MSTDFLILKNSFNLHKKTLRKLSDTVKALLAILGGYTLLLLMDYSTHHQHEGTLCIFKLITGVPCPGCGIGRGTIAFFNGNFADAFSSNILCIPITICIIISICWLLFDLFRGKETFFRTINRRIPFYYLVPFFILTAISWAINIYRGI